MTRVRALENTLSAETVTAGSDAASATSFSAEPMSVLAPISADEVAEIMKWASREAVGVLPFCGGSRLPAVSEDHPYVAVSTSRLSGVEIYEAADLTVTAGAGTPFTTIDRVLRENRQWAPFNPPRVEDRSLGGLVALGESGSLWMGYGELRNHVLGMTVVTGDGYRGYPDEAPFDGIVVTAAPEDVPQPLLDQLRVGGRLVIPVGANLQELEVIERTESGFDRRSVIPVRFVPMTGEARKKLPQ